MTPLGLGDRLPDWRFATGPGEAAPLSTLASGPLALVFLRHLA